jgi:hypothetical protein
LSSITLLPDLIETLEAKTPAGRFRKYTLRLFIRDSEKGNELLSITRGSINEQFKQFMNSENFSGWSFSRVA